MTYSGFGCKVAIGRRRTLSNQILNQLLFWKRSVSVRLNLLDLADEVNDLTKRMKEIEVGETIGLFLKSRRMTEYRIERRKARRARKLSVMRHTRGRRLR